MSGSLSGRLLRGPGCDRWPPGLHGVEAALEDAAASAVMVELGAEYAREAVPPDVHLGREQHAERRSHEVDRERGPSGRGEGRGEAPRGVHSQPKERGLEGYVRLY